MFAFRLDRWLIIKKAATTQDSTTGEVTLDWDSPSESHRVRGERVYMRGAERYAAMQNVASQQVRFRVRYPRTWAPEPAENWRLVDTTDGNRAYDIVAIDPMRMRRDGLEITATARAE